MDIVSSRVLINSNEARELFIKLYGESSLEMQKSRYLDLLDKFEKNFSSKDILIFLSPGRTEISGNHTDHNHGKVLGGSINLDCVAVAGINHTDKINLISETFNQNITIDLGRLEPSEKKSGTADLIRGMAQGFKNENHKISGFDVYLTSNVIASAGVSSSAAFETLICQIINTLFNEDKLDKLDYAHISKYAENVYWDKASGLLDQMCCAVGGLINIDFKNPKSPLVKQIDFDFASANHSLIIVQTGRGHADLSADYSAIPEEMKRVASFFGKEVLADVYENEFYENFTKVREFAGDRSVIRAIHFFDENKRVDKEVKALEEGDFNTFLENITESGNSSWKYLQNCYTDTSIQEQGITLTLALTEHFIKEKKRGACRVHGGGFAGVIMAMLPDDIAGEYVNYIERYIGEGNAYKMNIRPLGSICFNKEVE